MSGTKIRMTQYSHGAGCGCKISPARLKTILSSIYTLPDDRLLVGNTLHDDAAVYDMGNGECIVFTTDFFMPIVDDAYDFGRIAAANALSDIYAMGGKPILALSLLGWPLDKLDVQHARPVVEGGRDMCAQVGVPIAGGHSIDNQEPLYGLAVVGTVSKNNIKTNSGAKENDLLFYTKSLGIGILTTAEKRDKLKQDEIGLAKDEMLKLNTIGSLLSEISEVHALTDITGFGLFGHLVEMCDGSSLSAEIHFSRLHTLTDLSHYIESGTVAGGLKNNWQSYENKIVPIDDPARSIMCDPQTSGGLLIAVSQSGAEKVIELLKKNGLSKYSVPIGKMFKRNEVFKNSNAKDKAEYIVRVV